MGRETRAGSVFTGVGAGAGGAGLAFMIGVEDGDGAVFFRTTNAGGWMTALADVARRRNASAAHIAMVDEIFIFIVAPLPSAGLNDRLLRQHNAR
jgi:hypothetical protein